jgi:hypothetical protein
MTGRAMSTRAASTSVELAPSPRGHRDPAGSEVRARRRGPQRLGAGRDGDLEPARTVAEDERGRAGRDAGDADLDRRRHGAREH